jgi:hypothetical protein
MESITNHITSQSQTKLRQMQQTQMLNQTGGNNLMNNLGQFRMNMPPNGLNNMQKTALQNARPGYVKDSTFYCQQVLMP